MTINIPVPIVGNGLNFLLAVVAVGLILTTLGAVFGILPWSFPKWVARRAAAVFSFYIVIGWLLSILVGG